jgi:hypothetical protein
MSKFLIALPLSILTHGWSKKTRMFKRLESKKLPSSFPIEVPFIGRVGIWVKF